MRVVLSLLGLVAMSLCAGAPSWAGVVVQRESLVAPEAASSVALCEEVALVRRELDARLRALVYAAPDREREALQELLRHPDLTAALDRALRGRSSETLAHRLRERPSALRSLVFRIAVRMPSIVPRIESIHARTQAQLEDLLLPYPAQTRSAARALLRTLEPDDCVGRLAEGARTRPQR